MKLDKHNSVPLYAQLKEILLNRIQNGDYEPGSQIPSELALCEELQLSRPTVRQAISELVAEGTLIIEKGRGTFVSADPERIDLNRFNAFSFSFLSMKNLDDIIVDQIIQIEADETDLNIFSNDHSVQNGLWKIEWTLKSKSQVFGWCSTVIPVSMFPELSNDLRQNKPMIDIVANKYAFLPQKGQMRILVRASGPGESRQLDISRRSPVIAITSVLTSKSGLVCEVVRTVFRTDLVAINLDQGR
jgi:GntR family transcriptional regulator